MKVALVILSFVIMVFAETQEWNRTTVLEITGEAKQEIEPEYFVLSPEVLIFSNKSKNAFDSVKIITDKLLANIGKIDSTAIVTMTDISVSSTDRWGRDENRRGAYKANAEIEITSRRVDLASEMMKTCIDASATEVGLPRLMSSKTDSISGVLRGKAFQDAQQRAGKSASQYGATLGKVISVRSTEAFPAKLDVISEKIFGRAHPKSRSDLIGSLMGSDDLIEGRKLVLKEEVDVYYELKWK